MARSESVVPLMPAALRDNTKRAAARQMPGKCAADTKRQHTARCCGDRAGINRGIHEDDPSHARRIVQGELGGDGSPGREAHDVHLGNTEAVENGCERCSAALQCVGGIGGSHTLGMSESQKIGHD